MSSSSEKPNAAAPATTWSGYESDDPKLASLYGKGKALQWDAAEAIDWSRPVDPSGPLHAAAFPLLELPLFERLDASQRDRLTAGLTEHALSQFLHGEQGALMVAARLVAVCPDFDAKMYAATQTIDEARHVEVFSRYLTRCGAIAPVEPTLQRFLQAVLEADTWIKMLIGMQVVVEGAALSSFHAYRQQTRDPLLGDLLDGIIRDEARHVGFGTIYVARTVRTMASDDVEALGDYAFDTVMAFSATRAASLRANAAGLAEVGIGLDDVMRDAAAWRASGKRSRADATRDGIGDFIVPTLRRLGVVTPRIEERLQSARIHAAASSPLMIHIDTLLGQEDSAT